MKKWLGNLLLMFCTLGLLFGFAEVATRLMWRQDTHFLYQILPDGLHLTPNTDAVYKSSEFQFRVTSNRFGRRDSQWTDDVMKDPENIVFVGDSFVFGYGVDDADSVPTALERQFSDHGHAKKEVFNFGLGGALPEYKTLTQEAIKIGINAKTILIGIFLGNDFTEIPIYSRADEPAPAPQSRFKMPTLDDSAFYRFVKVRVSSSTLFTGLIFKVGQWLGRDLYPTDTGYIFLRNPSEKQRTLFYSLLEESLNIQKVAQENDRHVVFAIFPNRVQVENASDLTSSVYDAAIPDHRIMDYCSQHGLSCVDLLPILRNAYLSGNRSLFFPVDRHMNAQGNRIAAAALWDYLQNQQELSLR